MRQRLVLGTAQLGMPYGINNHSGQPSLEEASAIVDAAWRQGIHVFDTAQAYGNSEDVLGQALLGLRIQDQARIMSKLDPGLDLRDRACLDRALACSLKNLKVKKLFGLMLHHERQMDAWKAGLGAWLLEQRQRGRVETIGVSVYTPSKALEALGWDEVDFVQVPSNILDRRFDEAGVFTRAQELNKGVYIRSVFLQGLLLMNPSALPEHMSFAQEALSKVNALAKRLGLSVEELCLGYVMAKWPHAVIVFGAETTAQVVRNSSMTARWTERYALAELDDFMGACDARIVDPTQWS